jgi:hypothetical protein
MLARDAAIRAAHHLARRATVDGLFNPALTGRDDFCDLARSLEIAAQRARLIGRAATDSSALLASLATAAALLDRMRVAAARLIEAGDLHTELRSQRP